MVRIPRQASRRLAGWRVLCPSCSYSRIFLPVSVKEDDGLVTITSFTCARCHCEVEVADVPIKDTGAVWGCCGSVSPRSGAPR